MNNLSRITRVNKVSMCRACGNVKSNCICEELAFTVIEGQIYSKKVVDGNDCVTCNSYNCSNCSRYNFN